MPPIITPVSGPVIASEPTQPTSSQQEARARAIAKLSTQAQTAPVANPNNISAEEISAISTTSDKEPLQNDTTEGSQAIESAGETATEETVAKTEPEKAPLSAQFAQLARKEKAMRRQAQELRAREDAIKAKEAALAPAPQPQFDPKKYIARDQFETNQEAVLSELGFTSEQIAAVMLNAPNPEQTQTKQTLARYDAKIKALEDKLAASESAAQNQQTESYKQAVNQIKQDAEKLVQTDPNYEVIRETNSVNDVVDLIEKTFKADGILLSVEEAAQAVEDHLLEEAIKISRIKKIQQKLAPKPAPKQPAASNPQQPQLKTLTNASSTQRKLSAKERAILAFKGELTK